MLDFVRRFSIPAALLTSAAILGAQTPPPSAAQAEAAAVSQARTLIDQKDVARASALTRDLLTKYPASTAVLNVAVAAEIARAGAMPALDTYERWFQTQHVEHPPALRDIARALLHEAARDTSAGGARTQAVSLLVADGDPTIAAELAQSTTPAEPTDPGLLAAAGNEQAITALIAELERPLPTRRSAMAALARSKNSRAVRPIATLLLDPDPNIRRLAAEALGQLGSPQAVSPLKALLNDPVFTVKFAAASALYTLNDQSGAPLLRQMLSSEYPGVRIDAARAMKAHPDAAWMQAVRTMTADADSDIRRQAAELLAPHDPSAARAVLEPLLQDGNPAIREAAGDAFYGAAAADFDVLRKALRSPDRPTRVAAAGRILELTR